MTTLTLPKEKVFLNKVWKHLRTLSEKMPLFLMATDGIKSPSIICIKGAFHNLSRVMLAYPESSNPYQQEVKSKISVIYGIDYYDMERDTSEAYTQFSIEKPYINAFCNSGAFHIHGDDLEAVMRVILDEKDEGLYKS